MAATEKVITPQRLEQVYHALGAELCHALEALTDKLHYEFQIPARRKHASPREYAELREAKSLVSYIKYPDPMSGVRADELGWALKRVIESCRQELRRDGVALLDRAAKMLGMNLAHPFLIPADLCKKIDNELHMMGVLEDESAIAAVA